jgi:hypothetical protein
MRFERRMKAHGEPIQKLFLDEPDTPEASRH